MLVFGRQISDTIVIGKTGDVLTEPIVVTVVALRNNGARLGVDAQRDIAVDRGEIAAKIERAGPMGGNDDERANDGRWN